MATILKVRWSSYISQYLGERIVPEKQHVEIIVIPKHVMQQSLKNHSIRLSGRDYQIDEENRGISLGCIHDLSVNPLDNLDGWSWSETELTSFQQTLSHLTQNVAVQPNLGAPFLGAGKE